MNCPQCHKPYTQVRPAVTIPYCGDSFCLPCMKSMLQSQGYIWCIHHPPTDIYSKSKQNFKNRSNPQDRMQNKKQFKTQAQSNNQNDQTSLLQSRTFLQKEYDYADKYSHYCNFQSSNILNNTAEQFQKVQDELSNSYQNQFLSNFESQKPVPKKITNLNQLAVNMTIMSLALTLCKQHNEQKTLFCLKDGCNICSTCALFGSHKGHQMMLASEVNKKQRQLRSKINKISYNLLEGQYRGFSKAKKSSNAFPQCLKSNQISRKDEIKKWLDISVAKVTHKVQMQYHRALQILRNQKQKLLIETVRRVQQLATKLSLVPTEVQRQSQTIQKRVNFLKEMASPHEFMLYDYKYNVIEQSTRIEELLAQDLRSKVSSYDEIIERFQIKTICFFSGSLNAKVKSPNPSQPSYENLEYSTQFYNLLNGLDQQQLSSIKSQSRSIKNPELSQKQIKKLKKEKGKDRVSQNQTLQNQTLMISYSIDQEGNYQDDYQDNYYKFKESNNFTEDSIHSVQNIKINKKKSQQKQILLKQEKTKVQGQRQTNLKRFNKPKQVVKSKNLSEKNLLKTKDDRQKSKNLSTNKRKLSSKKIPSSAKQSSISKPMSSATVLLSSASKPVLSCATAFSSSKQVSSMFGDTIKFYKYPEPNQVIILPSIKRIQASQIYLDNFKAIQILKKAIASKANIKYVNFEDNKLTEKILEFIANNPALSRLKSVNLKGNKVKAKEGCRFIQKLSELGIKIQLEQK